MQVSIADGTVVTNSIVAISNMVPMANIECRANGISVCAMDGLSICLVSMHLYHDAFQTYICNEDFQVGLPLEKLAECIARIGDRSKLEISYKSGSDHIQFKYTSLLSSLVSSFDINLMTIESEEAYRMLDLTFSSEFTMSSRELKTIVTSLSTFGEALTILVKRTEVQFAVEGDMGNGLISIHQPLFPVMACFRNVNIETAEEELSQTVSIQYMSIIAKSTHLSDVVRVRVSTEGPILIEYKMHDVGYVRYYLAPIIEEA